MKIYIQFIISILLLISPFLASLVSAGTFYLDYSTYLGGGSNDQGWAVRVNDEGMAYICGRTESADFPTSFAVQIQDSGNYDAFVSRMGASGSNLIFSTYLGGSGDDTGCSLAIDSNGSTYICGITDSADFPTKIPVQATKAGGTDIFITKLSSGGNELSYSTFLGGSGDDGGRGVTLAEEKAYITGYTNSLDFPTRECCQAALRGGKDSFVSLLSNSGSQLFYSTYLGGSSEDCGTGIAVDGEGSAYIVGWTKSVDFPTCNAYQPTKAAGDVTYDGFISKLSSQSSVIIYSTYLGGSNHDLPDGVVLDESGDAYIAGETFSDNFPTVSPWQTSRAGSYDAFVSSLSSSGATLNFSTYLGGSGLDCTGGRYDSAAAGSGISLNDIGDVCLTGITQSVDFPTRNAYQAVHGGGMEDVFITVFASSGTSLLYSSYFGGSGNDYGYGIDTGSNRWIYLTGYTTSGNFPTADPYQPSRAGSSDVFLSKLKWISPTPSITPTPSVTSTPSPTVTPSVTITPRPSPSPTASVSPTPGDNTTCHPAFYVKVLEGVNIHSVRSQDADGWTYYFKPYPNLTESLNWGYIKDNENSFNSVTDFNKYYQLYINLKPGQEEWNIHDGDYLVLTHDGGVKLKVYLPRITGTGAGWLIYPDEAGNTYHDRKLCNLWQSKPTPVPTTSITPSPSSPESHHDPDCSDFSGDGTSDIAVFRPAFGLWSVRSLTRIYFGGADDNPVPGDYNGDGTADYAIFRGDSGLWAARGLTRVYFGSDSDQAVPADYNGDGTRDIGIFRSSSGLWALKGLSRIYFGSSSDIPIPGDYTGDGTKNIGIFRPNSGLWALRSISRIYFGNQEDEAVPGDYSGTGNWLSGIFRSGIGLWAIRGTSRLYFGGISDSPVPADFSGDGTDLIAIFRANSGLWAIRNLTRVYYGAANDIPLSR